jgi:hypothetical protein
MVPDTLGGCINPPTTSPNCPRGYTSDGQGNCVPPSVPLSIVTCALGYHEDSKGDCLLDTVSLKCPDGYFSDGNGNCISAKKTTEFAIT